MSRVNLKQDLILGAKSLALTLSSGAGSVPIPDTCQIVGVKPVSSVSIRVGMEAPEAGGGSVAARCFLLIRRGGRRVEAA